MKMRHLFLLTVTFLTLAFTLNTFAQDSPQWHLPEGAKVRLGKGSINEIAYSPDGTRLAVASSIGIWIYDTQTGEELDLITGHTDSVLSVSFSPNGQTIASGGGWDDKTVRLWDAQTGRHIHILTGHTDGVRSVAFSPDGQTIASGSSDKTIRLWDVNTGTHIRTLTGHTYPVMSVAFSPDGQTIASGEGQSWERTVRLWDTKTGTLLRTLTGHATSSGTSVMFSLDGQTIASGNLLDNIDLDDTIRLWDVKTGALLHKLIGHTGSVTSVVFSPDGQMIASGSYDKTVRLWDARTGTSLGILTGHTSGVRSVAFSPDGQIIASGSSDETIRLWDANTGTHIRTLTGHIGSVTSVAFSPEGYTLASAGSRYNDTIRLWNVGTGTLLYTFTRPRASGVNSVVFSPDGQTIASAEGLGVDLWNVRTATRIHTFSRQGPAIRSETVAFSTDGNTLANGGQAYGSWNDTVRLWDMRSGAYIRTLTGYTGQVNSVAFSPDGNTLASGSGHGTVLLWQLAPTSMESKRLAADVNKDGVVNIIDLTLVASNFGATGQNAADVNNDGVVNIIDLTLVAAAFGNTAAAPEVRHLNLDSVITRAQIKQWLSEARQLNLTDLTFQRGLAVLEQLLAALTPKETVLLPNYPNPFNPETWIPYQLSKPADVTIFIYAADGKLVRTLDLGHQPVGIYESRSRAAYWDGRNALGEPVASGVYFYTLTAGEFTATRKMLTQK